ncbi:hypothetical protein BGZ63DRAFT_432266 [Mariannaea sp. PMI_226]|nr:hypothetical protein BGZ63DRAFT_432266 [Mariannaea sp. PMI_226]
MDHLPQLKDTSDPYPVVPFLGSTSSIDFSFHDFPSRHGWDQARLEGGDVQQSRDGREVAAFLQTWLYFGLLSELSAAASCEGLKKDYFVQQQGASQVITTRGLDQFIASRVKCIVRISNKKRSGELERLNSALDHARLMTDRLWALHRAHGNSFPLPIEITASIMVLGCTIDSALRKANITTPRRNWNLSKLAKSNMQMRGWCRRDISLADTYLSELSMYCVMHLRRNTAGQSHMRCTEYACDANQVDESNYITKHRTSGCQCNFWAVDPAKLQETISQGRIPYIELKRNTKANGIGLSSLQPSLQSFGNSIVEGPHNRLVIFSHVWSDGLGNPYQNALPLCQLQYFYDMLCDSPWEDVVGSQMADPSVKNPKSVPKSWRRWKRTQFNSPVKIWIDTLCVPLEPKTKKMAIGMLKRYYSLASMTAVLDGELTQLCHKSYTECELLLRIGLSGWMRRCWTMQEAIVAGGSLCVRFADGWFSLPDVVARLRKKNSISPHLMNDEQQATIKRMRRGLKCIILPLKGCIFVVTAPQMLCEWLARLICVKAPKAAWTAAQPAQVSIPPLTASEQLLEDAKSFFAVITDLCRGLPPQDPERTTVRIRRVALAWQGLSYRNTSKAPDRFINFAFACAKREADFALIRDVLFAQQSSEDRLRAWFQAQGHVPAGLIFMKGPKMDLPGYRWAPNDVHPAIIRDHAAAIVTNGGGKGPRAPQGSLQLQKPGLMFSGSVTLGTKTIEVVEGRNAKRYVVELDWETTSAGSEELRMASGLALVLSGDPLPDMSTSAALLANVVRNGYTYVGQFCCGAQAHLVRSGDTNRGETTDIMTGQWLAEEQVWIVT